MMSERLAAGRNAVWIALVSCVFFATGCRGNPKEQAQKYLQSGLQYQMQGKLREAVIQFSNALQIDKNLVDAHHALGETYLALGDTAEGYRELARTVQLSPSNIKARSELGLVLLNMGAPIERSLDQCKAVLRINPDDADAYNLLARIDLRQGDRAKALVDAQHAVSLDSNRSIFHTTLAMVEAGTPAGEAEASKELEKAIALDPRNAEARLVTAELLQRSRDFSGAITQQMAAIDASPLNAKARIILAELYLRQENKSSAEETLKKAAEDFPNSERVVGSLKDFYLRTGQPSRVEPAYAVLAVAHSQSVPIGMEYARSLMENNEYDQAAKVIEKLAQLSGSYPRVKMLKALLLIHAGKIDEANSLLQQAAIDAPERTDVRLLLARTAMLKGDWTFAEAGYNEAYQRDPGSLAALEGLASIANRRDDSKLLLKIADQSLRSHPEFLHAYVWRATAEVQQKLYGKAEADLEKVLKADPKDAEACRESGKLRLLQGRASEGKALLERSLSEDPNSVETLNLLLQQDLKEGGIPKQMSRMQSLTAVSPQNASLYIALASLQLSAGDFRSAAGNAKKAIELNSPDIAALQIYARAEIVLKDTEAAVTEWTKWLQSHPKDARAETIIGMLEEAVGNTESAMGFYKDAIHIDPGQALAANNLAFLMLDRGQDLPAALSLAQSARKALPDSPNTADTLGWAYYHVQDYAPARDLFEAASKRTPKDATIHYHLGLTYLKLNDKVQAELHLKKALVLAAPATRASQDAAFALAHL